MTTIYPLNEGTFTVGKDKVFYPFDLEKENLSEREAGSLLVEVQPFAIVNDGDVILLDTGLGLQTDKGKLQIAENLLKVNLHPEDVTKVLISHLHKDHSNGAGTAIEQAIFPNATFYIYKREMDFALEKGAPSYSIENLKNIYTHDKVIWLNDSKGTIDDYITYQHSGGHCPEHIVFWITTEEGEKIFYGGDEASQSRQMRMKYSAKYDYDGKKAMQLREQWGEQAKKEGWKILCYHDVSTPVVTL